MGDSGETPERNFMVLDNENPYNSMTWATADGVVSMAVRGGLDHYTSPGFKNVLLQEIADNPDVRALSLDLTETEYIDTTVLGILVGATRRLRPRQVEPDDRPIEITVKDRNIAKIFEITGLDRIFKIVEAKDEPESAD
jgi:anti-anti-sigma factor